MSLKKIIEDKIISPNNMQTTYSSVGEIIEYIDEHNVATVCFIDTLGNERIADRVPIKSQQNGIRQSSFKKGDIVSIEFGNGSVFQPKISGKVDNDYFFNTREKQKHPKSGCFLPNLVNGDVEEAEGKTSDTWLDLENTNEYKTLSYKDASPQRYLFNITKDMSYFKNSDVGLINEEKGSIIKIDEDGNICIFSSGNVGVKVNVNTKTIEFFGNNSTISEEWSVLSNNISIISNNVDIKSQNINLTTHKIKVNGKEVFND